MRKPFLVALTGLALIGCSGGGEAGPDAAPSDGGPCQIKAAVEGTPGSPFNVQEFKDTIWPELQGTCGTAGCHLAPATSNTYSIWASSDPTCPDIQSFNAFYDRVDFRVNVSNSLILRNLDGSVAIHAGLVENPLVAKLRAFIQAGFDQFGGGGDFSGFFDEDVYAQQIQPLIDSLGCANAGCHDKVAAAGTLGLNPNPAAGSAELKENFATMTTYVSQDDPSADQTTLYFRASDQHRFVTFDADGLTALKGWIQDALDALGRPDDGNVVLCAPEAKFNVGVFRDEIKPLLEGRVDYNDIDGGRTSTGCARSECHGRNRGAGTFYLDPQGTPEQQINSIRCFVDLSNPSASQVLLCPLNLRGCNKRPHPGEDIFFGVDDRNYQKFLAWIYGIENGNSPLDFAFFVRKINPIFNDINAVQDGALGLTCASSGCHRSVGGVADNGSNFPIFPEATDPADLFTNFIAAANFTHFPDAAQSSLFLYPTNEVANTDNPLATGLQHPGGECFAIDDQEAIDIIKFSGGVRPNAQGFLQDFLVAGLFSATDVTDDALFNEVTVEPKIFDRSGQGQQFNQGQWDGFFALDENIDLLQAFQVDNAIDQLSYNIVYVVNTTSNPLETVVTITSENDVELFVGDSANIGRDGVGVSVSKTLPAFQDTKELTRIMLKVFQQADEATFGFTMQFTDRDNNLLTDATKELVFVLAKSTGGI